MVSQSSCLKASITASRLPCGGAEGMSDRFSWGSCEGPPPRVFALYGLLFPRESGWYLVGSLQWGLRSPGVELFIQDVFSLHPCPPPHRGRHAKTPPLYLIQRLASRLQGAGQRALNSTALRIPVFLAFILTQRQLLSSL